MTLRPQPGPQEEFLATSADIAIYGGAAGAGKTFAELLEAVRHINVKGAGTVIFRRESSQIANEGGPWDTAQEIYGPMGARFVESPKYIAKWKNGFKVTFSHMQLERHVRQWDGSQLLLICFDELQHFTERQFWYMLSRNRSTCGVRPYMRATCNPDPDSFLLKLLSWWIYQTPEDIPKGVDAVPGDPIKERSGVIRWFVRIGGIMHWGNSKEELIETFGPKTKPKSFTFISASLQDNQELLRQDPDYEANIDALLDFERKRLKGNWFARPTAGELFKRTYFEIIEPEDFDEADTLSSVRYWDRAATEVSEQNDDPDYTVGLRMVESAFGHFVITDVSRGRYDPGDVVATMDHVINMDGYNTDVGLEQEPGSSGKIEVSMYEKRYAEYSVFKYPKTKSKLTCWKPLAVAAKEGKVKVLRGAWNSDFFSELEGCTDGTQDGHDDQADSAAGAFNHLNNSEHGMRDIGVNL